jgi:transposase, IS30 family
MSFGEASAVMGRGATSGRRWAVEVGGVIPDFVYRPAPLGRYLCLRERIQIQLGIHLGLSMREMARGLGRSPSTVLREVRRVLPRQQYRTRRLLRAAAAGTRPVGAARRTGWRYCAETAQRTAEAAVTAAARSRPTKLASNHRLRVLVQERLAEEHSPAQIAAWLRLEFPQDPEMQVSHETIYKALYVQGRGELRRDLHQRLRTGRALRRPRGSYGRANQASRIAGMVNISQRPAEADDRAVPGHWEGDLIVGAASRSAIGTLVERASRFVMLLHLPEGHGADAVQEAMVVAMSTLPATLRRTLAWDQGTEMANHAQIAEALELDIYFCDPHSPWQRGTNENTNGLLRQYFPKGTDLSIYQPDYLDHVAAKLNRRPRQTLGWKTPAQALDQLLSRPDNEDGVASPA